jgi:hypothetical protein
MACESEDIQTEMETEDDIFSELQEKEREIEEKEKTIEKQKKTIEEKDKIIEGKDKIIEELKKQLLSTTVPKK